MKNKSITFLLLIVLFASPVFASGGGEENISAALSQEINNGTTVNFFPLFPELELPAGITVHLLMLLMSAILILIVFFLAKNTASIKPKKFLIAVESVILFVQDDIVFPVMGKERGEKWMPFFCTLFIFLLTINFLGLIPAFKAATGNINVTTALAAMILVLIFFVGIKSLGTKKFFANFYPEGAPGPIGFFVAFLEFVGLFIKAFVLSLRLFANMFAGHLAILSFLVLIFVLSPLVGIVAVPFSLFTYLLETLVGLIQALVFTLLSCIFITMASSTH